MKSFSNETLNFLSRKFWASYVLDLPRNFEMKEVWALENHLNVNMVFYSSLFTKVQLYIGT